MSFVGYRKLDVALAEHHARFGATRIDRAKRLGQQREPLESNRLKDRLAIAEVVIRGLVAYPGICCNLAKGQAVRPIFGDVGHRRSQHLVPKPFCHKLDTIKFGN